MTLYDAQAVLQGQASTVAGGGVLQQVAAAISGDAEAEAGLRGFFNGSGAAIGDAVVVPSTRVDKFSAAAVVGDAVTAFANPLYLVDGPDMSGDASATGGADVLLGGSSEVSGDAVVVAQGNTLLEGGSSVSGDATVGATVMATRFASGLASPDKFSDWSVVFDGSNEYATMGDALGFERTDSFSISCWVKTSAGGFLISKQASGSPSGYLLQVGAATGTPSHGIIRFELNNTWVTNNLVVETTTAWANGEWHHICVTYNGSSSPTGIVIYVDGSDQAPLTTVYSNLSATILSGAAFIIGDRQLDLGSKPFGGLVDEVAVYSKELSPAEVGWVYNSGVPQDLGGVGAPSDLTAWFRMGDGDTYPILSNQVMGTATFPTIPDESGFGHPGTMTGMSPSDIVDDTPGGISTKSLLYAAGDYVTVGDVCDITRTSPWSLSIWVKYTYAVSTWSKFLGKHAGGGTGGFVLGMDSSGKPSFYIQDDTGTTIEIYWLTSLADGNWHHIVVTYDGSSANSGLHMYVDSAGGGTTGWGPLTSNTTNAASLQLGAFLSYYYVGQFDEVAIYDAELSPTEAAWIYNSGAPRRLDDAGAPANLIGWWRMGEGTADATMVNMEVEDFISDTPYEAAGGGATFTARALEDDEIAGDILAGAETAAASSMVLGASAVGQGSASVSPMAIVRKAGLQPGPGPVELVESMRYIGVQPDRKDHAQEPKITGVLTDPADIRRANQSAQRQFTVAKKDTGVTSTPKK